MALINIFTRETPTIAGYEFDAVLEDTLDASVQLTGFNVEFGARAVDHRIINPIQWTITGGVSNNPLSVSATDFVGALVPDIGGAGAAVAGLSAGFLSGSDETRASSTLAFLMDLLQTGESFDVDAGDIQLTDMNIERVRRTADPENEGGLIFIAELAEIPRLNTSLTTEQPINSQLRDGDPASTQATGDVNRGVLTGSAPSASSLSAIGGFA